MQSHWQMEGQFYTRAVAPALHADSFEGTRALGGHVVGSQDSIAEALDAASSGKGECRGTPTPPFHPFRVYSVQP